MLSSSKWQQDYWPIPTHPGEAYLLAHQAVAQVWAGAPGFQLVSNTYLKSRWSDTLQTEELVYGRGLTHQYLNFLTPKYRVREEVNTLSALLEWSTTSITYVQTEYPVDTPTARAGILATGLYQGKSVYHLWSPQDYWWRSDSLNYRHGTLPYQGQPFRWELDLVLAERLRRTPRTPGRGTPTPTQDLTRQEHVDFRPYRPLDPLNPQLLPDALVQAVSEDQVVVEAMALELLDRLLQPDQITQTVQTQAYQAQQFPATQVQIAAPPNQAWVDLRAQVQAAPQDWISLKGMG